MKILICLCTSLFLLLVIFLAGAKRGSSSPYYCRIVAGTLHYFVLTTFCWAAIEGVSLYLDFVKIFRKDDPVKFMVVSSGLAWGCSLVVVLITAGVANSSYITNEFCIIRGNYFYFGLLIPVAVILFINISILILAMGKISKSLAQKEDYNRIIRSCRIAFGCSSLLGLTWVFGLFAFGDNGYTFQILFVIFNSLQGFFLFILNVPLNREVRREWRHLIADVCNKKNRQSKRKRCLDRGHTNNC